MKRGGGWYYRGFAAGVFGSYTRARWRGMEGKRTMLDLHEKQRLMSASEIERTLVRLAHQILEKSAGGRAPGLVGIERRGVPLAERLAKLLETLTREPVDRGRLNIQLYRDDLSATGPRPVVKPVAVGFDVTGRDILLVDDVLYTGRTVRAALDALIDHGRPRRVQLLALIDRGHRELPIEAQFVGRTVATSEDQTVEVRLKETDDVEEVVMVEHAA